MGVYAHRGSGGPNGLPVLSVHVRGASSTAGKVRRFVGVQRLQEVLSLVLSGQVNLKASQPGCQPSRFWLLAYSSHDS